MQLLDLLVLHELIGHLALGAIQTVGLDQLADLRDDFTLALLPVALRFQLTVFFRLLGALATGPLGRVLQLDLATLGAVGVFLLLLLGAARLLFVRQPRFKELILQRISHGQGFQ